VSEEASRLISAALRDHVREPAPAHLRRKLEQRYLGRGRRQWLAPTISAFGGALAAALVLLLVRPAVIEAPDIATEAVGDHLRVLVKPGLDVESNDYHNVKPWFAGKLDFTPPVSFLGDEEFPLKGGDMAVFLGHKAATFVYGHRLHKISLFVFQDAEVPEGERTLQGFHVATWSGSGGFGYALVSDVSWDSMRVLRSRLQ
jgi:anti-sigma factor RsiW